MDSQIRNKMVDFEVPPPAGTWEKLSDRLDEWQHDRFMATKMESIAIDPPPPAWDNILARLNEGAANKGVVRTMPLRKWLVAASLIGVLAVSAYLLLNPKNNGASEISVVQTPVNPAPENTTVQPTQENSGAEMTTLDNRSTSSLLASMSTSLVRKARRAMMAIDEMPEADTRRSQTSEKAHHQTANNDLGVLSASTAGTNSDRYYNLLDENGNLVRVSKKLSSLECVIKNGMVVPLDDKTATGDEDCTEKVKEWHKIMSSAPAITSPLDLLQVLSSGK